MRMRLLLTQKLLCRQHNEKVDVTDENDSEEQQQASAGRWDAYWGYDLIQEKGLLDAVLTRLHVKESSWPGLKQIPEVCRIV